MPKSSTRYSLLWMIIVMIAILCYSSSSPLLAQYNIVPVEPDLLSNTYVRCFFKDSQGFMWLGTSDGLIRYDGTNTFVYEHKPSDSHSLCHNSINVIKEDAQQRIWIGTAFGICIYDQANDNFYNIDLAKHNQNHLNSSFITDLTFDQYGKVWIATHGGGINVYDPDKGIFEYILNESVNSTTPNYVICLLKQGDSMWCGTKGGLKLFDIQDRSPQQLPFIETDLVNKQVTQLISEKAGNIWFSTNDGDIIKLVSDQDTGTYTVKKIFSGSTDIGASWSNILTICLDVKGNLWIGGDNAGLNYLNTRTTELIKYPNDQETKGTFKTNSIRAVYEDNEGLTWIGTYTKGAYIIDNRPNHFLSSWINKNRSSDIIDEDVKAFVEDGDGNIWAAVDGLGLYKLSPQKIKFEKAHVLNALLTNKFIKALICDSENNLWVGTGSSGVFKINLRTLEVENYMLQSEGFGENNVYCLYEDKMGRIWAGTSGSGLFFFDNQKEEFRSLCETDKEVHISKTAYVSSVLEDTQGTLWVGTMYGLFELHEQAPFSYNYKWYLQTNSSESLSSSGIQTLYEDKEKNLWIGTSDNGLNRLSLGENVFHTYDKASNGLSSNNIRGILTDVAGVLWISGNKGLSRFNPHDESITNFTSEDGLPSNNFNHNAGLLSSKGELFFGTNNGFSAFYPDSIERNTTTPKLYLSDLQINNQSVEIGEVGSPLEKHISLSESITLSYDQRSFMIDFVAINYGQSVRHQYCYQLEGFDKDWNCIGSRHNATYTNLDPGKYTFMVKASNNNGVWSSTPTKLEILIKPMIWKTNWAMSLYALIISGALFLFIKIRTGRVNMKNELNLERKAREREHELSESKTQFFTNISHEFRTPLSLILMPLENLLGTSQLPDQVKERVGTIKTSVNKMLRLINELMDFTKLEDAQLKLQVRRGELVSFITEIASVFADLAEKRSIQLGIHSMESTIDGWFDSDKLEKVIVNVLSNAFKFTSDSGEINIMINCEEIDLIRSLELIIVDNGVGISQEELPYVFQKFYQAKSSDKVPGSGTGIGLSLTKGLIELHKGRIEVDSVLGQETKFTIRIPIEKEVYEEDDICAPLILSTHQSSFSELEVEGQVEISRMGKNKQDKPNILVVEDVDELREYVSMELRELYNVWQASDGVSGLEIANEKGPDLIITDILMPNKSGIELCGEIKKNIKTSHIPVILLTAKATVEDKILGVSTGADVYITKPFSIRYLVAHISQIIDSRQQLYSRFSQDVYLMPSRVSGNQIDQEFLQKAIDYIISNVMDSQLGVDSIAELFHLSRMQTYRKIKALTGKSIVDFIRMVRVKQALRLMETHRYSISEIAHQTGFSSASYFTRCFKDQYGKAPTEYLEYHS